MKLFLPLIMIIFAQLWLSASAVSGGGAAAKAAKPGQWTLRDTVSQALKHSPAVKREKETVNMQKQNVRQAKAGYMPKLDVQASGGAATLPVSRNE